MFNEDKVDCEDTKEKRAYSTDDNPKQKSNRRKSHRRKVKQQLKDLKDDANFGEK